MKTKFTKGQWSISDIITTNEHGVLSQQIDCQEAGLLSMISIYHNTELTEEDSANAKLVAAAPDLFSACFSALQILKSENIFGHARLSLENAILKATE